MNTKAVEIVVTESMLREVNPVIPVEVRKFFPTITKYQRECWQGYKQALNLPENYAYLYGNPVKVHVPVETATHGAMIVGAYPTAHFNTVESIPDVPVGDHLYPFSSEKYFDGSRVRTINSGSELEEHYLNPLGLSRGQCWITDLVKVFLFKAGHIERYRKLGRRDAAATRNDFKAYATASLPFLYREITLAQPKIILLLGAEVTAVLFGCSEEKAKSLMAPREIVREIEGHERTFFALPHPGIVMRRSERGIHWKKKLEKELIPTVREFWSS